MKANFMEKEFLGINYWASYAGTAMWENWDIQKIEEDFKKLAACKITVLRVFPIWSVFQPLKPLLGHNGVMQELSHGEEFLDERTEEGKAAVSVQAMEKFQAFADLAEKYGFKLIVSLINGWMSGRCFFPESFVGRNVITDPLCVKWETLYVKYFVKRFKNQKNIIAWEAGNECNCLSPVETSEQAYVWASTIADSIRTQDDTRPIISGMHGLGSGAWRIQDQADICDYLTVHPYWMYTQHCRYDPLVSPRTILHSPAEMTLYSDMGGKPCFVEEIGTLGPTVGCDEKVADFVRAAFFNAWAHGSCGIFWWTGFDQLDLYFAPYDWAETERELGIFRCDGTAKPAVNEFYKFGEFLEKIPYKNVPERNRHAICLLDPGCWSDAYGAFMLAKRAGIELEFSNKYEYMRESNFYILPGACGVMRHRFYMDLLEKVKAGATLLITFDNELLVPFNEIVGCKVLRRKQSGGVEFIIDDEKIFVSREFALDLEPITAEVVLRDLEGKPLMTKNAYGKGNVIFFNGALEKYMGTTPGVALSTTGYEKIYTYAKEVAGIKEIVEKQNIQTNLTIHKIDAENYLIIAINNTEEVIQDVLAFNGVEVSKIYYGNIDGNTIKLPSADAVVFEVRIISK